MQYVRNILCVALVSATLAGCGSYYGNRGYGNPGYNAYYGYSPGYYGNNGYYYNNNANWNQPRRYYYGQGNYYGNNWNNPRYTCWGCY